MNGPEFVPEWGLIPQPVIEAIQRLVQKLARSSEALSGMTWPEGPGDVEDLFQAAIRATHDANQASTELRALLTAYAHRFHQPRPVMAELARAQKSSSAGLTRRYNQRQIDALLALLSPTPDLAIIQAGFPSLTPTTTADCA